MKTKNWKVMYGTGAGDFEFTGTADEAMAKADEGAAHTQQSYMIKAEDGEEWIRSWVGVEFDPEETETTESEIISFGTFGYYDAWQ